MNTSIRKTRKSVTGHGIIPILFALILVISISLPSASALTVDAATTGTVSAQSAVKPGNISHLIVTTYKARKGLSKKKYNMKYRLVVLTWTKAKNANQYQILYSYKKNGTYKKAVKKPVAGKAASTGYLSYKLSYKNNKKVFFKIVPYNGSTAGSASTWVATKAGNTKKNATKVKITGGNATLYVGDTKSYSATTKPKKPFIKGVRWSSTNSSIVKVSSAGKVTAVNQGTALIYAMAHNGVRASVKINVLKVNAPTSVTVNWGIKSSKINWGAASGAQGYEIYSRITQNGKDMKIATVGASVTSYTDTYYNTSSKTVSASLKSAPAYLKYTYYLDPTVNPLRYTVRAIKNVNGQVKRSAAVEDFHLEPPTIGTAAAPSSGKVKLTWGRSMMADGYYIYNGSAGSDGKGANWKRIATVNASSDAATKIVYSANVTYNSSMPYYTVKAYAYKNGKICYSGFDRTFHIDERSAYSGNKVLFIGDSITYGTPYAAVTTPSNPYYPGSDPTIFSYPRRLNQLTGVQVTDLSRPGALYTYVDGFTSSSHACLTGDNGATTYNISSDYDVVVLSAGTNDAKYVDAANIGTLTDTDNTTFTGALNVIMKGIETASKTRSTPVKVVFVDMFYRGDNGAPSQETMKAFQDQLHAVADYWNGKSDIETYKCNESSAYLTASNAQTYSSDFLHLTRYSQGQFGSILANYLIDKGIITK